MMILINNNKRNKIRPRGYKTFSWSTQLSMIFFPLIEKADFLYFFYTYEHLKFHGQLS